MLPYLNNSCRKNTESLSNAVIHGLIISKGKVATKSEENRSNYIKYSWYMQGSTACCIVNARLLFVM